MPGSENMPNLFETLFLDEINSHSLSREPGRPAALPRDMIDLYGPDIFCRYFSPKNFSIMIIRKILQ